MNNNNYVFQVDDAIQMQNILDGLRSGGLEAAKKLQTIFNTHLAIHPIHRSPAWQHSYREMKKLEKAMRGQTRPLLPKTETTEYGRLDFREVDNAQNFTERRGGEPRIFRSELLDVLCQRTA